MFYSQFILAKKGPLGTIWIAAHLERKLRKNQVADTDIGVSVDSILFPEVPIALRLSSHLLLGVVRIYSRKVNYLFNDCSEALLKIKQAFRSTAVDLPPEESTAPYHSITLPETFDLDDFELPDSEFFQGNYVDHHVSSKEQITLQDTMDGVVYSTSKFGLDERFGDGDTSQIGLDLDEDLFSEKVAASGNAGLPGSEEGSNPHVAGQNNSVFANMDVDEYQGTEERNYETTDTMPIAGSGDQIDDTPVILSRHSIESQIPSSPGLTELANEPDVKDVAAFNLEKRTLLPDSVDVMMSDVPCKHHLEADCHNSTDLVAKENLGNPSSRPDLYCNGVLNDKSSDTVLGMPTGENVSLAGFPEVSPVKQQGDSVFTSQAADLSASDVPGSMSSPTSVLAEQLKPVSPVSECSDRIIAATDTHEKVETSQNGGFINKEPNVSSVDQSQMGGVEPQGASLDCAAASTGSFETSTLEEHITKQNCSIESVTRTNLSSDCLPEDKSGNNHDSHRETSESEALRNVCIVGDVNSSCLSNNTVMSSDGCLLGSASRDELENDRTTYKLEPQGPKIIETVCSDEIPCTHSHVLQACNSKMSESNIQPLAEQNSKFGSEASDISFRGDGISLAGAEEAFQATEVQGELSHTNDGPNCPDQGLEANKITKNILSEDMMTDLKKSDDHQENIILSDTQFKTLNCDISSDLPAPEKLLSAPEEVADLPNNLIAEPTPENQAREAVRGDGFKEILSGQKRRLMETTPVLQSQDSDKLSGVRQFERTVDGVPEDDDLLSSILVGRRSSAFKMKPTPPEVVSSKRPRLTPRVNVSKRKVLLDDIMVLHGDTIRQQLTSTEGIRRIRKKAPCTRPEIWMIQNILLEEEVFSEPILTGMSAELICVHNQTYDLSECKVSPEDAIHTSLEVLKDTEPSGSIDVTKKTSNEESIGLVVVSDHGGQPTETFLQTQNKENLDPSVESFSGQPAETFLQNQNQQNLEPSVDSFGCDTQFQTESLINTPLHESLTDGELVKMAELNTEKGNDGIADVSDKSATTRDELFPPVGPPSGDNCSMSVDTVTFSPFINKNNGSEVTLQNDELCLSPDQKIDNQSVVKDGFILTTDDGKVDDSKEVAKANEDNFISIEDACRESNASSLEGAEGTGAVDVFAPKFHVCQLSPGEYTSTTATTTVLDLVETRAELVTASSTLPENSSASLLNGYPETGVQNGVVDITNVQATELITGNKVGIVNEDEVVAGKLISDEEDPPSKPLCSEEHQHDSSYSPKVNVNMKDVSSTEKENPCCLEAELSSMDVEVTALDNAATRDPWDHSDVIVGNDTEFLNVDDDEVAEEEDNSMPSTEDAQIFENTGWSSRTRAVAKYLQILFHKEAGHGRKDVPLDNLLAGKTRKEASRMFFETLVLKTRDYIHVEQENPFDNVHIKPRVKLMKSDL